MQLLVQTLWRFMTFDISYHRPEPFVEVFVNSHTRETPTSSSALSRCEDNRRAQWRVHTRCKDKQSEWWSLNFCLMLVTSVHALLLNGILHPWQIENVMKCETIVSKLARSKLKSWQIDSWQDDTTNPARPGNWVWNLHWDICNVHIAELFLCKQAEGALEEKGRVGGSQQEAANLNYLFNWNEFVFF